MEKCSRKEGRSKNSWWVLVSIVFSARTSTFGLARLFASLIVLLGVFAASANAQTDSTWNGGTGNWSDSGNWNPAVPNNSGSATYDVTIGVANSNVTMDVLNDTIDNLTLEATSSLTITSNTLSLVSGASFDNGRITNNGDIFNNSLGASLTVSGFFLNESTLSGTFTPSTLNNDGKLFITADGSVFNQDEGTINNSGTLTNAGILDMLSGSINNSGTLTNTSGGIFTLLSGGIINSGKLYNYGMVHNEDMITNNSGGSLTNYGTINNITAGIINHGTLLNTAGGTINNIAMAGLSNYGMLANAGTLNSDSRLNNYGTLNNSGTLFSSGDDTGLGPNTLNNYGTLNNSGTLTNTCAVPFSNSSTLNNYGTLNNSGTLLNTPASTFFSVSTINNSGTINNRGTITNADTIINNGTFTNSGFVNITSTGLFTTSTNYKQTAGQTFVNGTLTATGPAIVDIHAGILGGGGTINGNVLMAGRMIAGMPDTPLTLLINGNYEQTGTGIYDELISSNANGLLQVSGAAKLDPGAALDIFLLGGFDPSNGTSFTILDYGSESGAFAIRDPLFNGGTQKWVISSYNGGDGDDIVLTAEANNVATTPEPANTLLLGTVLLVAAWYAQKKRSEHAQ
jgi:hypothetical protein